MMACSRVIVKTFFEALNFDGTHSANAVSYTHLMVSCPLMTVDGQVFGLAQKSSGHDTATICYAIDATFAMSQNISALSYGDMLSLIHISTMSAATSALDFKG